MLKITDDQKGRRERFLSSFKSVVKFFGFGALIMCVGTMMVFGDMYLLSIHLYAGAAVAVVVEFFAVCALIAYLDSD